jgi:hypothetical protein
MNQEKAVQFIMNFYNVNRKIACELYADEIAAYVQLLEMHDEESNQ